jgi:hypothetical protein
MHSTFASELVKVHLRFTGRSSLNPARDHGTIAATAVAMSHEAAPRRASMTSTVKRAICPAARADWPERVGDTHHYRRFSSGNGMFEIICGAATGAT